MMCAQHALNAILQDSYFDPAQLAQIAEEIQGYERGELGVSTSQAESSQHMDETGFFSVEVIDRALRAWDMQLVRWRNCNALRDRYPHPEREFAFLLNFGSHWLALRGFGHQSRVWYVALLTQGTISTVSSRRRSGSATRTWRHFFLRYGTRLT